MPGSNSPDFAATQLLGDVAQQPARYLCMLWFRKGRRCMPVFSLSTLPEASLGYAVAVYPQGGNGDDLVNEIKKILADDVKNGLPAELIEAARRHEIVDAEFQRNSVSGLGHGLVARRLLSKAAQSPDDDIQAIGKASVADVGPCGAAISDSRWRHHRSS